MNSINTSSSAEAASPKAFTEDSIYGDAIWDMRAAMNDVLTQIDHFRNERKKTSGEDPVEHCLARIKSDTSMREKCRRKGLPETADSALSLVKDAIGIRVVCAFLNDIMAVRDFLTEVPGYEVVNEKDFIRQAKPNGYRSYHLILRVRGLYVEVQLRTISMDTWAALEHQLHYKKDQRENDALIVSELKRCADELASTDISMQTIRDMIHQEGMFAADQDQT